MRFCFLLLIFLSFKAFGWSVSTYNIRNFNQDASGPTDIKELVAMIKSNKSDVMAFEEVVNQEAFEDLIKQNFPEYEFLVSNCGGFGRQKLALVFQKNKFKFVSQKEDLRFSGPNGEKCGSLRPVLFVTLRLLETKEEFTFGLVHLKAGGSARAMQQRWEQYKLLNTTASSFSRKNLILLGDFNTTGYNIKDEDFNKFQKFLDNAFLKTTSEQILCSSYWNGGADTGVYYPSLLDHIVFGESLENKLKSINVGAHCAKNSCRPAPAADLGVSFEKVSDHCPIRVVFE